ncbi:hypothetical protein DSM106972_096700 [Dulcicalothrix desertica PCC 7102]|uniref:Uncharacterized protein n=1 Tax=Dulcicalothrix desertica PCC 7102 TaxID=232991 RepID=A0A433UHN9_9CYAN|nr:hypothetical protein [Dulcicalothrix desertica]RUS93314.1 hypothetical protein DSM106972_096700 [Dulcicalothrix desertica PCC 7102]TWH62773.1 hypothetical protein CAL7102_00296 [Dulcicalothrix desertica PCC 7102]
MLNHKSNNSLGNGASIFDGALKQSKIRIVHNLFAMRVTRTIVYLSQLKDIAVLFPGDIHRLAEFILDCSEAADRINDITHQSNIRHSRPTLHGLSKHFAELTQVHVSLVVKKLEVLEVDFNSAIEFDLPDGTKKRKRAPKTFT